MWNAGLDEAEAGIKIAGRNINNLRYADDTTLMAESEELKNFLMKVKEESEKFGLKFNIQKTKIMASGPITSWEIDGETVETVTDFILGGSKITADGDCSHETKRLLVPGSKAMTNLNSILKKQRHYFADKGPFSKQSGFSCSHVWMWELDHKESWAPKNWRFWIVVLENLLDCKEIKPVNPKGNQSWIFIGKTDGEAENSNTSATWYEQLTHLKRPWCWEKLKAGGEGDDKGWDGWMVGWLDAIQLDGQFEQAQGVDDGQGSLGASVHGIAKSRTQSDWTELKEIALVREEAWPPG